MQSRAGIIMSSSSKKDHFSNHMRGYPAINTDITHTRGHLITRRLSGLRVGGWPLGTSSKLRRTDNLRSIRSSSSTRSIRCMSNIQKSVNLKERRRRSSMKGYNAVEPSSLDKQKEIRSNF